MTWAIGCAIGFFTIGILLWRAATNAQHITHLEDLLAEGHRQPEPQEMAREYRQWLRALPETKPRLYDQETDAA